MTQLATSAYMIKLDRLCAMVRASLLTGLVAAGNANAVHINPEGLGQVLFYPYYTVRNNYITALSVVNTTNLTKAVKVRFLEGKNGREVFDFNLFLSPADIWTGVVLPTADGTKLETGDNSCVTPSDLFGNNNGAIRNDTTGLPLNAFNNTQYTGVNVDSPTLGTLDRTREGYIEVFEMGIVVDATMAALIKHNVVGVPANCAALDGYDALSGPVAPAIKLPGPYLGSPAGGLTGRASIINAASGANYTYDVTALDGWWAPVAPAPGNVPYSAAGVVTPSISQQVGIDTVSYVLVTGNPAVANSSGVLRAVWASPREAVSAVLMRTNTINEFVTDAGTKSKTDWVITMPTKRDYVGVGSGKPSGLFRNNFATTEVGACEAYAYRAFNREAGGPNNTGPIVLPAALLPPKQPVEEPNLCWQTNVIELGESGLLGSTNSTPLTKFGTGFTSQGAVTRGAAFATLSRRDLQGPNGWGFIAFGATANAAQAAQSITPLSATLNGVAVLGTHFGLPVIGMMFHNYTNSAVASTYGGVISHKYLRRFDTSGNSGL